MHRRVALGVLRVTICVLHFACHVVHPPLDVVRCYVLSIAFYGQRCAFLRSGVAFYVLRSPFCVARVVFLCFTFCALPCTFRVLRFRSAFYVPRSPFLSLWRVTFYV